MIRVILALSILILNSAAHATLGDEFRDGFKKALQTLAETQVKNLGPQTSSQTYTLAQALAEQITYVEVPNLEKPEGATRASAFAVCAKKTVFINRAALGNGPVPLPIIIHESLGALCVQDFNYEFSTLLAFLVEAKQTGFYLPSRDKFAGTSFDSVARRMLRLGGRDQGRWLEGLAEQAKLQHLNSVMYASGATIIGSAGDEDSASIKLLFVKNYIQWIEHGTIDGSFNSSYSRRILQVFLNVKIERIQTRKTKIGYVRMYESKDKYVFNPKNLYKQSFYFYVPSSMSVQQAADEIFNFMTRYLGYGPNFRERGFVPHLGG